MKLYNIGFIAGPDTTGLAEAPDTNFVLADNFDDALSVAKSIAGDTLIVASIQVQLAGGIAIAPAILNAHVKANTLLSSSSDITDAEVVTSNETTDGAANG